MLAEVLFQHAGKAEVVADVHCPDPGQGVLF